MLARNSEFKGKELEKLTKDAIRELHNKGVIFIVGDMPNVDSQFIDYLQEIGATFTIYHTGSESRIKIEDDKVEIKTYSGKIIKLEDNQIFVFGSNPEGRHGAGSAKLAKNRFGAKYGNGRGLQGQSYALPTKNLKAGFTEKETGITYEKSGEKSLTPNQITINITELYNVARNNPNKEFLIAYSGEATNLNGYSPQEMANMFSNAGPIPSNIVFNENFVGLLNPKFITDKVERDVVISKQIESTQLTIDWDRINNITDKESKQRKKDC